MEIPDSLSASLSPFGQAMISPLLNPFENSVSANPMALPNDNDFCFNSRDEIMFEDPPQDIHPINDVYVSKNPDRYHSVNNQPIQFQDQVNTNPDKQALLFTNEELTNISSQFESLFQTMETADNILNGIYCTVDHLKTKIESQKQDLKQIHDDSKEIVSLLSEYSIPSMSEIFDH
ncbi:hypothetical protein WA158_003917 [Blastocystis sp. Blastoise]